MNKTEYISGAKMKYYGELLDELLAVDSGLTDWEVEFIENMSKWRGLFSVRQAAKIEKIHGERI
jgi:phage antirepressor YoqD-like protein